MKTLISIANKFIVFAFYLLLFFTSYAQTDTVKVAVTITPEQQAE